MPKSVTKVSWFWPALCRISKASSNMLPLCWRCYFVRSWAEISRCFLDTAQCFVFWGVVCSCCRKSKFPASLTVYGCVLGKKEKTICLCWLGSGCRRQQSGALWMLTAIHAQRGTSCQCVKKTCHFPTAACLDSCLRVPLTCMYSSKRDCVSAVVIWLSTAIQRWKVHSLADHTSESAWVGLLLADKARMIDNCDKNSRQLLQFDVSVTLPKYYMQY